MNLTSTSKRHWLKLLGASMLTGVN